MRVKVGCCGFQGARREYFRRFRLVEVQQTFYKLPRLETVLKWREEAPEGFDFTVKVWQGLTHTPKSPTWKRSGIPASEAEGYGTFLPTGKNLEAWRKFVDICSALRARKCVFQTPPSFKYSKENAGRVERFFSKIDRQGLQVCWEPRGDWLENPDVIRRLCTRLNIVHVVDLLCRRPTATPGGQGYFRLHGLGGKEINYSYRYTNDDLRRLSQLLSELPVVEEVYVLFNNLTMLEDSSRLKGILEKEYGMEVI